jgi:hypothetical protein
MTLFQKKSATPPSLSSSAKVVDGHLVLSLPDAMNPIVWRMELGHVKSSALEVRDVAGQPGHVQLILKTPKGEAHEIAPYAQREKAVAALLSVAAALEKPVQTTGEGTDSGSGIKMPFTIRWKWILIPAAILFVFYWILSMPSITPPSAQSSSTVTGGSNAPSGVPQSADDYLKDF